MRSFKFGGCDLSLYGVTIQGNPTWSAMAPVEIKVARVVAMHGGYRYSQLYLPRTISLSCNIVADSRYSLLENVRTISRILDIRAGEQQLILDTDPTRYILAGVNTGINPQLTISTGTFDIEMIATDPFWYDIGGESNTYTISGTPQIIVETTGGTMDVEPVITLKPSADIANRTTIILSVYNSGTAFEWVTPRKLTSSHTVVIDSKNWVVTLNDVTSLATKVAGAPFPLFTANDANVIMLTGVTSGTLQIDYNNRWL